MPTARTIFEKVDAQDIPGVAGYFAEDAIMIFGNAEPLVGRRAIVEANEQFYTSITAIRHSIRNEWTVGDTTILELEVTYTRLDDKDVTLPAVSLWHTTDGLITDYRVFYDPSPVFAT